MKRQFHDTDGEDFDNMDQCNRKYIKPNNYNEHRGDYYRSFLPQMVRFPDKYENLIFKAGDREIHFNTHVDGETISRVKKLISEIVDDHKSYLVEYDDKGVPEREEEDFVITYIVSSPGGSVHDILDFVDYIEILRNTYANLKFTSIITGMVASAGTIMCVIADNRKMTRFSYAMIHELSTGLARTNYTRIQTHAEFTDKLHKDLAKIYQERRGIDPENNEEMEKLERLLIRESWMTAEEYKAHGFVGEIIAVPGSFGHTVPKNKVD